MIEHCRWIGGIPARHVRYQCRILICSILGWMALSTIDAAAATMGSEPAIPAAQQEYLGQRFAPILIFHPRELYFPMRPDCNLGPISGLSLEKPAADFEEYKLLTLQQKISQSALYYRVYPIAVGRIAIEYWIYYIYNSYRAGGGIFRFYMNINHANDLEYIVVTLEKHPTLAGRYDYIISSVTASAHRINNFYKFPQSTGRGGRLAFLIERGSHAMAPDIGGNSRFLPEVDSNNNEKLTWGVRDKGIIWARYKNDYAEERPPEDSVVLCPEDQPIYKDYKNSYTYRLINESSLQKSIQGLGSKQTLEGCRDRNHVNWLWRTFGKSDGCDLNLILPRLHGSYGNPKRAAKDVQTSDHGFVVGFTQILGHHTFLAGGRYGIPVKHRILPNLMLDSQVFAGGRKGFFFENAAVGMYPLDAITNVFAGASLLTDSITYDKRQWSGLAGIEWRLGNWRVRTAFRTRGSISRAWIDFRLSLVFK